MVSFIIDLVVVHGTNPTPTMIQFGIMLLSTILKNGRCKIMGAYNFFCFRISGFEIVRTPEMGLGSYLTYL